MRKHEKIDYLELPAINLIVTKSFFSKVFGWKFVDYGSEYCAFSNAGIEGGFYQSDLSANTENGSALVVFYSEDLQATLDKIEKAGGIIVKAIFDFPGGQRFHFVEPSGNEFAVWSDTAEKTG